MLFTFLLTVQTIVAASLVAVILMQRSEGGGLVASSSGSLMTARGAADFLTRATAVLATLFVVLSIALAGVATVARAPVQIDPSLARQPASPAAPFGTPAAPITGAPPSPNNDPLAGAAEQAAGQTAPGTSAPAPIAPAPAGNPAAPQTK